MSVDAVLACLVAVALVGGLGSLLAPARVTPAERIAATLALGIAAVIASALVLDASPIGIRPVGWVLVAAVVVIAAAAVRGRPRVRLAVPRRVAVVTAAVVLTLTAGAVTLARTPLAPERPVGYELLWALPRAGGVDIGIQSEHLEPVAYRLYAAANGRPVLARARIGLGPGQRWEAPLELPAGTRVRVRLYRLGDRDPVRAVDVEVRR